MNRKFDEYRSSLDELERVGRMRSLKKPCHDNLIDCTSNDYLAIGRNVDLRRRFLERIEGYGTVPSFGSCSSRLLYTDSSVYNDFEHLLSSLYDREVLLYNTGYHANVGVISALAIPGTLIVSDRLVHASIIDGIRLTKVPRLIFSHNDIEDLERILIKESPSYRRVLVIVESVYSMDGDIAPLKELVELKKRFDNLMIYVDEAHAFGVFGKQGLGVCSQLGIVSEIDVIVGTLSKAAASIGAFVVLDKLLKMYLVNCSRSLIFSTAIPPVNILWSDFVVSHILKMSLERNRLAQIGLEMSRFFLNLTQKGHEQASPIVPFMIGGNERTLRASEIMREHGVMALPIRRPTVAEGTERLRISLNASLNDSDLERIKIAANCVAKELL